MLACTLGVYLCAQPFGLPTGRLRHLLPIDGRLCRIRRFARIEEQKVLCEEGALHLRVGRALASCTTYTNTHVRHSTYRASRTPRLRRVASHLQPIVLTTRLKPVSVEDIILDLPDR